MKYRRRPQTCEAEQFWPSKKPWPEGVYEDPWFVVRNSGHSVAAPGNYILTFPDGTRSVVSAEEFEAEWESVPKDSGVEQPWEAFPTPPLKTDYRVTMRAKREGADDGDE